MKTNSWDKDSGFLRIGKIFFLKKTLILDVCSNNSDEPIF